MSKEDTSGPAFPATYEDGSSGEYFTRYTEGMTPRDYFAAKAMQGMCASPGGKFPMQVSLKILAEGAYELADATLEARKK